MSPAVICIDYAVVGKWAEDRNIAYTSYPELSQMPEVYELVKREIVKMNHRSSPGRHGQEICEPLQGI